MISAYFLMTTVATSSFALHRPIGGYSSPFTPLRVDLKHLSLLSNTQSAPVVHIYVRINETESSQMWEGMCYFIIV